MHATGYIICCTTLKSKQYKDVTHNCLHPRHVPEFPSTWSSGLATPYWEVKIEEVRRWRKLMGWRNWLVNTLETCARHSCNRKDLRNPRLRLPMLLRQRMPWCSCMGKCNVRCKECHSGVEPGSEHLGQGMSSMARAWC